MKKTIQVFAVLLFLTSCLFAAVPVKAIRPNDQPKNDMITFSTLPTRNGIAVKFKKGAAGQAVVIIYDNDKNVLRKDILSNAKALGKGYVLTSLENGDYTVEVTFNKQVMTKAIHVYMEGQAKTFIIKS
jgi:hypothetical protein